MGDGRVPEFRGTGPIAGHPCASVTHLSWGPPGRASTSWDWWAGQQEGPQGPQEP